MVPSGQRSAVLQPLLSDTQYQVTVTPMYRDGHPGISTSALGATCKNTHTHSHSHPYTNTHKLELV